MSNEREDVKKIHTEALAYTDFVEEMDIIFAILEILVIFLAIFSYSWKIAPPLSQLTQGVRSFTQGHLFIPINIQGKDEISEISQAFNEMAQEVNTRAQHLAYHNYALEIAVSRRTKKLESMLKEAQRIKKARQQLLADVSHELRTPLTIIQGESDIALRGKTKTAEEYQEALRRTRDTAKHTNRLVDDLLFVSRQETGEVKLALEETDLVEFISDSASLFNSALSLQINVESAILSIDPQRIRQALFALLQNAKRYGGKKLSVRIDQTPTSYCIAVEDRGLGMSDVEKSHAFDRFFRGSNALSSNRAGSGLGLPIAQAIAKAHGGTVTLLDRKGGGLTSIIKLPRP